MTVVDRITGEKKTLIWTGMECRHGESDYFKALLNVAPNGDRQTAVTWRGCEFGETRPSGAGRDER
jgi:hypothetical protein